ncbi:Uncharacterised protein [Mycobacterium tuberculosis]|uniref:Uncharacterized protein n=1 Tax=Mycobacterium tuberculosis TaxID=1773 RepID=A0A654U2T3_MYCTX|nr:Uncharacterised protein [Mycobacterium tuberculosis]CFS28426.1 Uncharacterised protein [Mycobacterium tuberculosis]
MGLAHSAFIELRVSVSMVTVSSPPSPPSSWEAGVRRSTSIRMGQAMKSEYFLTRLRIFHSEV